jgi:two-component system invasion response regulator UvrY|uniref:Two component LuxR family transcriptional regulator n=1 Tax=uncultured bacterium ws034A6 TaxID=1131824 RepID=I1X594_9BACT|nr:two component LuxR family transcriptional regulator [uncultured bacterium ws034A6]
MINVMLVDDHDLVRSGIKRILTDVGDIDVVAEADSGEQAVKQARKIKPDVILMDLSMPGIGGLEATRKITRSMPDAKIIAVTIHEDDPFPARLLEAGAVGYLTKGCDVREIISAIKSVYLGEQYLTPDVAQKLALSFVNHRDKAPLEELTQRETQVMLMIVKGEPNKLISEKLCLSPKTTSTYRYRLFEKLGVANDVELTRFAIRHGLIKENIIH